MIKQKKKIAWKVSKYGVFSAPYFPAFGLNTERYSVSPYSVECGKIRTIKISVYGDFSRSGNELCLRNITIFLTKTTNLSTSGKLKTFTRNNIGYQNNIAFSLYETERFYK